MAGESRMDRRTIRRALARLEERGLVTRLRPGGPRHSAQYALVMPADGAPERHLVAVQGAISGRHTAPSDGAPQRPEQVGSRSENVGNQYAASGARSAGASHARGGTGKKKPRQPATPATPFRL
ncbi:hypothetical protein [Dankookia sp. P2]|uniref:hypothetical protein n=1 Tax=Dankookia sp. P2 TaxID=3423955 RepID=UPI003D66C495